MWVDSALSADNRHRDTNVHAPTCGYGKRAHVPQQALPLHTYIETTEKLSYLINNTCHIPDTRGGLGILQCRLSAGGSGVRTKEDPPTVPYFSTVRLFLFS